MSHQVYIGIGSNLNNPLIQVKTAITELKDSNNIHFIACSNIYESKALTTAENKQQPDYVNAVVKIETDYNPSVLLTFLQSLEQQHDRVKEYRWGPRTLDLDILLYDDLVMQTELLTIPHCEIANREFVLYPLYDIQPLLEIPKLGKLETLLEKHSNKNLKLIESAPE